MAWHDDQDGWHRGHEPRDAESQQNIATDNAHQNFQVGSNYGTIYYDGDQKTPEKSYKTACDHLNVGVIGEAEEILHELIKKGCQLPDLPYNYALSVLSGLTPSELDKSVRMRLATAERLSKGMLRGETAPAFQVLMDIVPEVLRQERERDRKEEPEVMRKLGALTKGYAEQLNEHLDQLISSVRSVHQERQQAELVAKERLRDDREERAWKFFEPTRRDRRRFRYFGKCSMR